MSDDSADQPSSPDLPNYLVSLLEAMPANQLRTVSRYASDLAEWKEE
jgi:hypothetical protein